MTEVVDQTILWYDQRASAFDAQTADVDMGSLYQRFLPHVRRGGHILDAGCGVGRDARAFVERGFAVTAMDASAEMVRLTAVRLGGRGIVVQRGFDDISWSKEFDGIWACASLLHVPPGNFEDVAQRLARALMPGCPWYMSFKFGQGERRVDGRLFVDHTEASLRSALTPVPVTVAEAWVTSDVRAGRENEKWINAIAIREIT
jgi:SAM-dependent methyltransferase